MMSFPIQKGRITRQAHVSLPPDTYEEEFGQDGFYGPVSHLYHRHAPTGWTRIEGPLRPHAYHTHPIETTEALPFFRQALLGNVDITLAMAVLTTSQPFFSRNADGDELWFVHEGQGVLETDFGPLEYAQGHYLVLPKGTTYRFEVRLPSRFLLIESRDGHFQPPQRGLLGQHALYDPAMLDIPTPAPSLMDVPNRRPENGEWELRIKRDDVQTSIFYPYCPLDVEGWKGDLTAYRLHIGDFLPVMSHRAHLAPSVHTTWTAGGFVVCSFVPRPLEEAPEAVRVPFYHRNIDYDEVIFYHDGDFFSRHGITPGMLTWHPAGIHHGPHPQAVAASRSKTRTNEVAVMVDTQRPLYPVSEALPGLEWQAYVDSWK